VTKLGRSDTETAQLPRPGRGVRAQRRRYQRLDRIANLLGANWPDRTLELQLARQLHDLVGALCPSEAEI
jgi:hypothetical protein